MSIPSSGSSTLRSASITSSRVGIQVSLVTLWRETAGPEQPDLRRDVLADSRQPRELPFLPTVLCLWGAGWATSLVTAFLFVGRAYPTAGSSAALYGLTSCSRRRSVQSWSATCLRAS